MSRPFPPGKPSTKNVFTQKLTVNDYQLPISDLSSNPQYVIATDAEGLLDFINVNDISGVVSGGGSGIDNAIVRWDGSDTVQSSLGFIDDSGITTLPDLYVANIHYPLADGGPQYVIATDGAGTLTLINANDVSGLVSGAGSGVDNRAVRWDGSENVQSSLVSIDDSGVTTIPDLYVAGIHYPLTDGTGGQGLLTNGAGSLYFSDVANGTGTFQHVARWGAAAGNLIDSLVIISDAGAMTGITSLTVANITYPTSDGTSGYAIVTNGAGTLSFASKLGGSGTDNRLMRWDGTTNAQDSGVTLDDSNNMTGIVNLTATGTVYLTGLRYPIADGTVGQVVTTDGAGNLTFADVTLSGSAGITGTGTDNRLVRWDGTSAVQDSAATLTDAGALSGLTGLSSTGTIALTGTVQLNGLTYPSSDGTLNQVLTTDGAGNLYFSTVTASGGGGGGGGVSGTGTDNHIVRWNGTGTSSIQDSGPIISDTNDITGVNSLVVDNYSVIGSPSFSYLTSTPNYHFAAVALQSQFANTTNMGSMLAALRCRLYTVSAAAAISSRDMLITSGFLGDTAQRGVAIASASGAIGGGISNTMVSAFQCTMYSDNVSAIMGSSNNTMNVSRNAVNLGTAGCTTASAYVTSIMASEDCTLQNSWRSSQISCYTCTTDGVVTNTMISCANTAFLGVFSLVDPPGSFRNTILSSSDVSFSSPTLGGNRSNLVWGGVNVKTWGIDSNTGTYYGIGGTTIVNSIPDFAEYFENSISGSIIDPGTLVRLRKGKVQPADMGETDLVIGVVSANPALIAGGSDFQWQGALMVDEWNRYIMEEVPVSTDDWMPAEGQSEKDRPTTKRYKLNPEWDPTIPYKSRKERPECWSPVALTGQVPVRIDDLVEEDLYIKPIDNGIGSISYRKTNIYCMKITSPYEKKRGYGIALCLVK